MNKNHRFSIPEPCHEDWSRMKPTEKGRFCDSCAKEVKDFTRSDPNEIAQTLLNSSTKVCGRFRKEQLAMPKVRLIDLIPNRHSHAAKVAATAMAFFSCDLAVSQRTPAKDVRGNFAYAQSVQEVNGEQIIQGVVVDGDSIPLSFANVIHTTADGISIGASCDLDGNFRLIIPATDGNKGDVEIKASNLGYSSKTIGVRPKENLFVEIRLDGSEHFMLGIIIAPQIKEEANEVKKEFIRVKECAVQTQEVKKSRIKETMIIGDVDVIEESLKKIFVEDDVDIFEELPILEITEIETEEVIDLQGIETKEITALGIAYREDLLMVDAVTIMAPQPTEPAENNSTVEFEEGSKEESISPIKSDQTAIELHPNPSSDILNVRSIGISVTQYRILDQGGSIVQKGRSSSKTFKIDTSQLSNGQYFMLLLDDKRVLESKQLIIQH